MSDCAFLPWKFLARLVLDAELRRNWTSERYLVVSKFKEWAFVQNVDSTSKESIGRLSARQGGGRRGVLGGLVLEDMLATYKGGCG